MLTRLECLTPPRTPTQRTSIPGRCGGKPNRVHVHKKISPDESAGSFADELYFNANNKGALIATLKQRRDVGVG